MRKISMRSAGEVISSGEKLAFSLVELSIVLVILGLLTGGILAGQSLIRAAELRSVTTQYQRYIAGVQSFRDKYFALPGDFTNAQAFWGTANATPATCVTTASTTTATCNGDGDGLISYPAAGSNETYRFWQHLANAGLIEGSYDGVTHGSSTYSSTTANSPVGRISSSLWFVANIGSPSGNSSIFDGNYGNVLEIGGIQPNYDPYIPIFKPEEAWNIDTKLDDGLPAQGKVVARDVNGFTGTNCTTATSSSVTSATYALSQSAKECVLYFRQQF